MGMEGESEREGERKGGEEGKEREGGGGGGIMQRGEMEGGRDD